jgi:hypothetical protein
MSNISISIRLDSDDHEVMPDLTEEEFFAIGRVTAGFAYMEHAILEDSVRMLERRRVLEIPTDVLVVSFDRRLRAWRKLIKKYRRGAPRDKLLKIITRIKALQKSRNRITHGLWNWEYDTPTQLSASTFKPSFEFTESFDFEKLFEVSKAIAQINFQLTFPKGKSDAYRVMAQRGAWVSRAFAMRASGAPLPPSVQRDFDSTVPSKTKPWLSEKK